MGLGFALVQRISATARQRDVVATVNQFENLATHGQYRVPYEITARQVAADDAVLDWGCGNGHFSMLLEELGARVTGFSFEPNPVAMHGSASFTFVAGSEADPRTLPFPADRFDACCSVGVLEHVWETGGDEPSSLAEIARVLKPGGVFLTFHLPNRRGWVEPVFRRLGLSTYFHERRYDAEQIRALWNAAGLQVEELGTYNFLPRNHLRILPGALRHARLFARAFDAIDAVLGTVLGRFSTNYYIVGRKQQ